MTGALCGGGVGVSGRAACARAPGGQARRTSLPCVPAREAASPIPVGRFRMGGPPRRRRGTATTPGTACRSGMGGGAPSQLLYTLADVGDVARDEPLQLIYLGVLVAGLGAGAFVVLRALLTQRELEGNLKLLQEASRDPEASAETLFEYGTLLIRKKVYQKGVAMCSRAEKKWELEGREVVELAPLYNAIGFAQFQMGDFQASVDAYTKATEVQPGYTLAWNNLGDAWEKVGGEEGMRNAVRCYREYLNYGGGANSALAKERMIALEDRIQRLYG